MEHSILYLTLILLYAASFPSSNDVAQDVTFRLFTINNKYDFQNLGFDVKNLTKSGFDFNKDTKIITHGFLNNGSGMSCIALRDAFLKNRDLNVIIVDYEKIADDFFTLPQTKVDNVGGYVAKFIDFLIENKYNRTKIHLLGHSLGGHIMGYAASHTTKGKVARVSGLDPAATSFLITDGLTSDVAEYVDVIHTCKGMFGATQSIGTVDFWPNGGICLNQPSCKGLGFICSHYEAVRYMSRSINDTQRYPARLCQDYDDYKYRKCENNNKAYMGIAASYPAKGDYYLCTHDERDYLN